MQEWTEEEQLLHRVKDPVEQNSQANNAERRGANPQLEHLPRGGLQAFRVGEDE
jgi:hypothetical protein